MENNNKTRWINKVLAELEMIPHTHSIKVLEACGRECMNSTSDKSIKIDAIRDTIHDKNDINLLFKMYKEIVYNNSDELYMKDNIIHLIYNECACGMVINGGITNPFLCNCTGGYTKAIFERLFDRRVKVKLKKTILRGDNFCEQEIILSDI